MSRPDRHTAPPPSKDARLTRPILACVGAGLALRALWGLLVPVVPISDSEAYRVFAANVIEHGTYGWRPDDPGAFWPPATSYIYAAPMSLLGTSGDGMATAVVLTNLGASVATIWLGMLLASRWFGRRAAIVTGALLACWPTMVLLTSTLASETLFVPVLLGAVLLADPTRGPTWPGWLGAGVTLGLAALLRPTSLLLAPMLGALGALRRGRPVAHATRALVAVVIMLALIAPWTARNHRVFGEHVLISTNGAPTFWMGNNPDSDGVYTRLPDWTEGMSEPERARRLRAEAVDHIKSDPGAFVLRTANKFLRLHTTETIGVHWTSEGIARSPLPRFLMSPIPRLGDVTPLKGLTTAFWLATLAMSPVGMVFLWRRDGLWKTITHPALVLWCYFAGVHSITVIQDRYHLQWAPLVMMLTAFAIARIWDAVRPAPASAAD